MSFNISVFNGQILLTASETYAGGGSGTTINLSEHIRQIVREELERHDAASSEGEK